MYSGGGGVCFAWHNCNFLKKQIAFYFILVFNCRHLSILEFICFPFLLFSKLKYFSNLTALVAVLIVTEGNGYEARQSCLL